MGGFRWQFDGLGDIAGWEGLGGNSGLEGLGDIVGWEGLGGNWMV